MRDVFTRACILIFFLWLSVGQIMAEEDGGSICGKVIDKTNKEPLIGATVQIGGTTLGTVTDGEGHFMIRNLKPGKYQVSIKYVSYKTIDMGNVQVAKGKSTTLDAEMVEADLALEGVVVVAQVKQNTEMAMLSAIKSGMLVQSGISAQQIQKMQDRNASEVIRRIPGISIIDDKFVMVRGLAQRYNNVWINNGAVPSSEADSRAFSFDVIPSSQMDNMVVVKSPAPELPADFSGGFIKINTKDVPETNGFSFSIAGSVNDRTHFKQFYSAPSSTTDFLGFDDGMRKLSGSYNSRMNNNDVAEVNQITRSGFDNNWTISHKRPASDLLLNASFNRTLHIEDKSLAIIATANYTNNYKSLIGMQNIRYSLYDIDKDKPDYKNKYTDDVYNHHVRVGGMINITFLPNKQDKYEFKNIVNQLGWSRYTTRSGVLFNSGEYVQEQQEYFYNSRTTYNGQFTGLYNRTHAKTDWSIGYAYANKNQPDRRIIDREENGFVGDAHKGEMRIDQNEIERMFYRLDEHIVSASFNHQRNLSIGNVTPSLKIGAYAEYRARIYNNRAFYYRYNNQNLPSGFEYLDVVNEILTPHYLDADKLYVYEDTDNRDSYKGKNFLSAGYMAVNIPLGRWNVYAGARYEYNRMQLTNYTTIKEWRTKNHSYSGGSLFPSVNADYKLNEKNQIRLAYGSSINRPEFRERSASVYYDFDLFSSVMGNKDLKQAYIHNADLRYEYYPSSNEIISAALFYKHFSHPIEWSYIDNGGSYTYTYLNAKSADNYGVEVEVKKELSCIGLYNFSWNFNGSWIHSRVHFDSGTLAKSRPMQGQSPYLINTGIFYQDNRRGLNMNVLYNRIGKRIMEVGNDDMSVGASVNNNFPDTYELARNTIDMNFSKSFAKHWEIKFSVRNLLAEKVVFIQYPKFYDTEGTLQKREQITKQYKPGRNVFLTLIYNL